MFEVFIIRLHGRRLPERLMRPVVVVEALEFGQLDVQGSDAQLAVVELVELVAAHRVGALDAAVVFWASGRQHEQFDAALLAGGLELGHELAAAVDLHRLEVERRLADEMVEESCGAGCGGARVGAHVAQLRDRAHGLELLDREAGLDGDAQVVDLHHLAGLAPAVAVAPAPGVAVELAPPLGLCSPVMECDGLGPAGPHQAGDHAPGGGLAGREAVLARQHGADLGAPPQRKAKARLAHQLELGGGPLALPHPVRAAAAVGQGADALLAQAPLPAVERRPRAAGRLQGGRLGRALEAKLVEQRERVEALGGLRRKFVADRVETIKFAVRIFDLHGALSRLSAVGFSLSAMLPQKFFARPLFPFGLRPTGKSGQSHMYLTPDTRLLSCPASPPRVPESALTMTWRKLARKKFRMY